MILQRIVAGTLLLVLPGAAFAAALFTDVPLTHRYATGIYDLRDRGVVRGNPDNSFAPDRPLNRAELVALANRAAGIEVRAVYRGCFPDVPDTAWFADDVCTLHYLGGINGYPSGMFIPNGYVNNVEALKIILNALGYATLTLTLENKVGLDFKNVNINSWYASFLYASVLHKLLPEELTRNNDFRPDAPMTRGVAAEILSRALHVPADERKRVPETKAQEQKEQEETGGQSQSNSEGEKLPTGASLVPFPLHRTAKTGERGTASYAFDFSAPGTILVEASNLSAVSSGLSCYLYLLGESGFSSEFFVGYKEKGSCFIRAALREGRYQLEVRTPAEGDEFSLDAAPATGDGNDGFIEATSLRVGSPRSSSLTANDYEDFFRFTVNNKVEKRRVELSAKTLVQCTIFPDENVDLFGETGPSCGAAFEYQPGTYYVSVKRPPPAAATLSYTIEIR